MQVVLMAGGGGTRLWPVSRRSNPKQFLDLGSGKTLLEHAYDRATQLTSPDKIFVATVAEYADHIKRLLPQVLPQNIFLEPSRRDNAPAFATVAVRLKLRGQAEEPTTFLWTDHVFTHEDEFIGDLKKVPALLEQFPDSVVILGHTPLFAETGFGYIEAGEKVPNESDIYHVKAFKEKPNKETAEKYLAAGTFFWNMAYVSIRPSYLLSQLREHEPELMKGVDQFEAALQEKDEAKASEVYGTLPKLSIDYALLEKTPRILAVTGDYGWSDVGNWSAVKDIFGVHGDHMPEGHHVHVDGEHNYIYNATAKAVSLIGLKNSIVVVTDDAVLVTDKAHAHKVKDVVAQLESAGKNEYL